MDVKFDIEKFRAVFAGFRDANKVSNESLEYCFQIASEIVGNSASAIPYDPEAKPAVLTREVVLDLVTCHIATMMYLWDDAQNGAVASATQGSVSVSFDNANSPEWWSQTKCGAQAWIILKRYKTGLLYYGVKTITLNA